MKFVADSHDPIPRSLILGLGTAGKDFCARLKLKAPINQLEKFNIDGIDSYANGYDSTDFDKTYVIKRIDEASRVLIVLFGGGESASEIAKFVVFHVHRRKLFLDVILSTPMLWEGKKRARKAAELVEYLRGAGARVNVIDGEFHNDSEQTDYKILFDQIDKKMLEAVSLYCVT
jgi:cell division GTPase FtsZ